jgi:signal transduction histidine kinase
VSWLAALGWAAATAGAVAALRSRRRLEHVARAEHEIRGPVAALALGCEQVRRGRSGAELAETLEAQLERSRAGLADLAAALGRGTPARPRSPSSVERLARRTVAGWKPVAEGAGRRMRFDWRAGPVTVAADRARLAQALGNLLSNAIEHGQGEVVVCGRRVGAAVRIEITDGGGNGLVRDGPRLARNDDATPRLVPRPQRERGRGLAIASSAAKEAGGSLSVVPGPAGTTAVLELPLEER